MLTFLLTWNASRGELNWARGIERKYKSKGHVRFKWACGNTKSIVEGDRVFFLRQRLEPRGIIGIGTVERAPYFDTHWDESRHDQALYVDALWHHFSEIPVIARSRLDHAPYSVVHWKTQKSGISVPENIADELEEEYFGWVKEPDFNLPEELPSSSTVVEGIKKRVTVNTYERNQRARALCIQHYGSSCQICKFNSADIYGSQLAGIIHVHHLVPVASIVESYEINPVTDLIPVCPNCHAVLHQSDPPYPVEKVKQMLKKRGSA
ncbi:MAG: HNH endonuclease [Fidelibacterota bacterium]|nr:MAG: HNH endonuclease [Candidatus Neomarinimicrobiota bacterium]